MTASLPLGRFSGIPIRAHWSTALVALLFGLSFTAQLGVVAGIVATVAFFLSILAHELGHALVARRHGVETQGIDLWALGGVARLDREAPTPRAEALIAVAGPAVSLVLGAVGLGVGVALESAAVFSIGFINALLAVFNMLPGAPLDGGRVVRAWRWARTGDRYRATRDAGNAGRVLGWSLGLLGVGLVFAGQPGIFLAVVGAFIAMSARVEIASSYVVEQFAGQRVGDLAWFGVAHAGNDMDADSMIWQRSRIGGAGAVAVDATGDGQIDGIVLEEQLWAVPTEQRGMTLLSQLMVPWDATARASADDDLASVLPRLNPARPIVTVWDGDRLAGIVPMAALRERLQRAQQAVAGT
ncbi:MAG: site-2 protease family protein [Actinomycetota bacterium]